MGVQKDKHGDLSMLLGGGGGMKLPPLPYLAGEMADYDMVRPLLQQCLAANAAAASTVQTSVLCRTLALRQLGAGPCRHA